MKNITSIIILCFLSQLLTAQSNRYTYDPLNRLTRVEYANGTILSYSYDANGNRTGKQISFNCLSRDSLALVQLYHDTNGPNWTNTWNFDEPVRDWHGIILNENGCVSEIYLDNNNLEGIISPELGSISSLVRLDLFSNKLSGTIPVELGRLYNLEHLWIYANQLSGSIPPQLGSLSKLTRLGIGNNNLTGCIPGELGNLDSLIHFSAKNNQLSGCYDINLANICAAGNSGIISEGNDLESWDDVCTTMDFCYQLQLDIKVILEGAYDTNTRKMTTLLNSERGLLPGQTPSSPLVTPTTPGQPYTIAPWNYTGQEGSNFSDADYVVQAVDWVLVSLRTSISKADEVAQIAALLMSNGTIHPVDCPISPREQGPYYVVIEHRNHMGVMSPQPIDIQDRTIRFDFTKQDSYRDATSYGQIEAAPGVWVMLAGDFNQTNDIQSYDVNGTDKIIWDENNGNFDQYLPGDANLDGDINGSDKIYWEKNNGRSSRVPRN